MNEVARPGESEVVPAPMPGAQPIVLRPDEGAPRRPLRPAAAACRRSTGAGSTISAATASATGRS